MQEVTHTAPEASHKPRVVIIGGGFGGLNAAQVFKRAGDEIEVIMIDRHNYHLFQPLLYQVATAGLSASDVAAPIRSVLSKQKNARVVLGEVTGIDRAAKIVELRDGQIDYDYLIIAAGMRNNYFGNDQWEQFAPGLKSIDEALDIRRRMLLAFERAEYEVDPEQRRQQLTFVIVGGGPTGVEMAGAIAEIATEVMAHDFRTLPEGAARIVLVEGEDRLLSGFSDESSARALEGLRERGVEVILNTRVGEIDAGGVRMGDRTIEAHNVIWAAGLKAQGIADSLDIEQDRAGRLIVSPQLTLPDDPCVLAIGDIAHFEDEEHGLLPGMAPVAIQQGKHAAKNVLRAIRGEQMTPFDYFDKGKMATIGRADAVAEVKQLKLGGVIAWLAWLFVHLMYLVGFRSKLSVMLDWFYSYVAFRRSTRLIVGAEGEGVGRRLLRRDPEHPVLTTDDADAQGVRRVVITEPSPQAA